MNLWFTEDWTDHLRVSLRIREVLHRERSPYQEICVYETADFGRLLTLDDIIQVTERDEFFYHEMLAHVPLVAHPSPRKVLIIGGGDGGTAREALKHGVEVVQVEIDERVVEAARRFLPTMAKSYDHPSLRLVIGDGIEYVKAAGEVYDVVLVDSTDPVGPAEGLFREAFFRDVFRCLSPEGMLAIQTESPLFSSSLVKGVQEALARVFPVVRLYWGPVVTYPGGIWSYSLGSRGPDPRDFDPARTRGLETRYYSEETHRAAFALPPFLRELAARP